MSVRKFLSVFLSLLLVLPANAYAQVWSWGNLPQPGQIVQLSPSFKPALLRGLTIFPDKPLQFDFILDQGEQKLESDTLKVESQRMVNYFLATLATPQKDLWVNLSPVEKDRIIPDQLIKTELGRDLLAQDYVLKQLASSLIYPEGTVGKAFWSKVYNEAYAKFGTTDVPVDIFNKVWIVPQDASVFEKGNTVYVTKVHLKVMLESDYQAMQQGVGSGEARASGDTDQVTALSKQLLRDVVVPAIEQEVNEGQNFAQLRQMVYTMVLAQWYQDVLKEGVLNKAYSGKNKVAGIDLSDPSNKQMIYEKYLDACKKGVFNYIKEETDRLTNEAVPKKYFSGGFAGRQITRNADTNAYAMAVNSRKISVQLTAIEKANIEKAKRNADFQIAEQAKQDFADAGKRFHDHLYWILFGEYQNEIARLKTENPFGFNEKAYATAHPFSEKIVVGGHLQRLVDNVKQWTPEFNSAVLWLQKRFVEQEAAKARFGKGSMTWKDMEEIIHDLSVGKDTIWVLGELSGDENGLNPDKFFNDVKAAREAKLLSFDVNRMAQAGIADFLLNELPLPEFMFKDGKNFEEAFKGGKGLKTLLKELQHILLDHPDAVIFHNDGARADILLNLLEPVLKSHLALSPLWLSVQGSIGEVRYVYNSSDYLATKVSVTQDVIYTISDYVKTLEKLTIAKKVTAPRVSDAKPAVENAMNGGIDARNISVDRKGALTSGIVSDQALEEILTNAAGVRGVIVGISPIQNLSSMFSVN
ncbi:MAG: hypothetical protein HQL19_02695 [Candidatus Omnitrophica bacterium]|nr:hypothetical protein [Candidatus Omnitrophota bacterium]